MTAVPPASSPDPAQTQAIDLKPARFGAAGAFLALLGALLLAMNEVSVLSSGFVLERGTPSSFNEMSGPGAWRGWDHWNDLFTGTQLENWRDLLTFYLLLDGAFILVYTSALILLLARIADVPRDREGEAAQVWPWRWGWAARPCALVAAVLVVGLALVDVLENAGQFWLGAQRDDEGGVNHLLENLVSGATGLKWVLVAVLIVGFAAAGVLSLWTASVRSRVRNVLSALWIQRFSLLVFFPVAALALLPLERLNNLFGQLPDVQRAWLDNLTGVWHFFAAGLVYCAVATGIFALGRIRSDWAARRVAGLGKWPFRNDDETARLPHYGLWVAGPAVLFALAVVAWVLGLIGSGGHAYWWRLFIFCIVPLAVIGASLLLKKVGERRASERTLPLRTDAWAATVMTVGDILAVTAISLTGLSMVRAITGLFALGRAGLLTYDYLVPPVVALLFGCALAILPWLTAPKILRIVHEARPAAEARAMRREQQVHSPPAGAQVPEPSGSSPGLVQRAVEGSTARSDAAARVLVPGYGTAAGPDYDEDTSWVFRYVLLFWSVVGFVLLAGLPRLTGLALGALGAVNLALGVLLGMLGALVVYGQDRQPMQLFSAIPSFPLLPKVKRFPGLRFQGFIASPIILCLMAAVLLSSVITTQLRLGQTDVHPVVGSGAIPDRPQLDAAFGAWLEQPGCSVTYRSDEDFTIRPMLLLAAEGGGMRATYWTAATLQTISTAGDRLGDEVGCGARAALFAGGASGGALGLTIGRFSDHPKDLVEQMAGPNALASAAVGLAAGDLLASLAGIRFPVRAKHRDPGWPALDRSGLMEIAWERESELEPLRTEFVPDPQDAATVQGSVTGHLILTSTEARNGCHALMSQVDLNDGIMFNGTHAKCGQGIAGDDSYDLLSAYGHFSDDDDDCLGNPQALTAGLLASRFPYVTPSGVVGECRGLEPTQLLDGGYSDNTGLGTVVGLAPTWTALVRDYNDTVLDAGSGALVVPMVVYMDNGDPTNYRRPTPYELSHPVEVEERLSTKPIPEILVPPIGRRNAKSHKVEARFALALAEQNAKASLCTATVDGCTTFLESDHADHQVFVVHQSNQPSIPAPLGWVLSEASQHDLDGDMTQQRTKGMHQMPNDPAAAADYASLHDLLVALGLIDAG